MAIYKEKIGAKRASVRQGILWAFWGFLAGIYCFQPMLKAAHRDEKSILAEYFEIDDNKVKDIKPEKENATKTDSSGPHS